MALEVAGSSPVREPTLNEWSTLSESDRVVLFGFALFEVQSYLSHVMRQVFFWYSQWSIYLFSGAVGTDSADASWANEMAMFPCDAVTLTS